MIRDGLVWPATDEICFDCIKKDVPFLIEALNYCTQLRTAIQAGGNAGMYPVVLSEHFDRVITFEPEALNYQCLEANTADIPNVQTINGIIGNSHHTVGLWGWEPNSGSYEVSGDGDVAQHIVDDFELTDVDFIQLDIQGFESAAIAGALETIAKSKPVIMLEEGHGLSPVPVLANLGYTEVAATRPANKSGIRDAVYVYRDA